MKTLAIAGSWARLIPQAALLAALLGFATQQPVLAAAARLPFDSGFETGDFREWDGGLEASMTVTSLQSAQGRYSAQSVMSLGSTTDNYKEYVFGDHPRAAGQPVSVETGLWLEFDVKFDAGIQFVDCQCVHKIAILNLEDQGGLRRYQLIINLWTPDRTYFVEHLKWNADRSFNRAFSSITQNIGPPVSARIGEWDHLKLFVKPNTPGQANGVVRMWVNGVLKTEYSNIPVREDTSYMPNKLIMSNYVNATTVTGIERWDNFYLGESDRGAPMVRPAAPFLREVR
jgi:hypothetical protein